MLRFSLLLALLLFAVLPASAQQKIGFVDTQRILERLPEYASVQQSLNQLAQEFTTELDRLQGEVDALEQEFAARELLYTDEERQRKQDEIRQARQELNQRRGQYFGPDGELFREEQTRLRPVQERVLTAIETVALDEDYDYVVDRGGELLLLFAKPEHDLTDFVLVELDIDTAVGGR
ncbi:MAG: OmpH family outer membrane protein [Bacteroidota bacterium]